MRSCCLVYRFLGFEQFMLGYIAVGIHVAGTALEFTHVALGIEGGIRYFGVLIVMLGGLPHE